MLSMLLNVQDGLAGWFAAAYAGEVVPFIACWAGFPFGGAYLVRLVGSAAFGA